MDRGGVFQILIVNRVVGADPSEWSMGALHH
jgi:hypothetical protein